MKSHKTAKNHAQSSSNTSCLVDFRLALYTFRAITYPVVVGITHNPLVDAREAAEARSVAGGLNTPDEDPENAVGPQVHRPVYMSTRSSSSRGRATEMSKITHADARTHVCGRET